MHTNSSLNLNRSEKKCFRWLKVWRKLSQEFQSLMSQYLSIMPGAIIINTINAGPGSKFEYHSPCVFPFAPVSRLPQLMRTWAWQGVGGVRYLLGSEARARLLMLNSISVSSLLENFQSTLRFEKFPVKVNTMTRASQLIPGIFKILY